MAAYERRGAELERRWAELTDSPAEHGGADAAEHVKAHTRQGAETVSSILMQLADALERTAALAEEHAQRHERLGRTDHALKERQAARQAREKAQRARSEAQQWLRPLGERET